MAIKRPDIYEHNNPNLPIVDSDFVKGGIRSAVQNVSDLYSLAAKTEQLKQHSTQVYVSGQDAFYLLKDINNIGNTNGWVKMTGVGGGGGTVSISNVVYTTGDQTVSGDKTFKKINIQAPNGVIVGYISGESLDNSYEKLIINGVGGGNEQNVVITSAGNTLQVGEGQTIISNTNGELKFQGTDTIYIQGTRDFNIGGGITTNFTNRPNVNGTGVLLQGEAAGISNNIINTTYSALTGLKAVTGLTPGQLYRISDFHLKWYNQSYYDTGVKSGLAPEPLIVLALSGNKISHEAKSQIYPEDTVYYDIDASGSYSWGTLNNDKAIPDFKGWIYRRIDHKNNIDIGWDWRNITVNCCRPIVTGIPIWTGNVNYNRYSVVRGTGISTMGLFGLIGGTTGKLYYSLADSNSGNSPSNNTWWAPISNFIEGETYFPTKETIGFVAYYRNGSLVSLPANTGTRIQQPTFTSSLTGLGSFSLINCKNIKIEGGDSNVILGEGFYKNTIGFDFSFNIIDRYFSANTIGNSFNSNKIGNSFGTNTIGYDFSYNNIEHHFYLNTIGNKFYSNIIQNYFYFNNISENFNYNTIGYNFIGNNIDNSFVNNQIGHDFSDNTIGNAFGNNNIANRFNSNTIGNYFSYNTIGYQFRMNTTEDNVSIGNVTGATHIYNSYNTRIFQNSNNTVRLSYFNSNDALVVTDPTA